MVWRKLASAVLVTLWLGSSAAWASPAPLLAQAPKAADEPTPPSTTSNNAQEPARPGSQAGASGEPGAPASGEPGAPARGEPGTNRINEPPAPPAAAVAAAAAPRRQFGLGLSIRSVFIHPWMMGAFLQESTPLNSMAIGGEFVYRKGTFDIVASVELGFYSPEDGNYLGKNKNAATDVDYLQFDGLNLLTFGVHFIKHHPILPWLSFIWGGGVGLGVVMGNIYRVSAGKGCDASTAGDEASCYPYAGWDPKNPEAWLNNSSNWGRDGDSCADAEKGKGDCDDYNNPKRFKEGSVWPVVPLVHFLLGVDFKITDSFGVRVDGGFRNSFYVGAAGHYFF